jgi:FtsH-binding integral membrane protein
MQAIHGLPWHIRPPGQAWRPSGDKRADGTMATRQKLIMALAIAQLLSLCCCIAIAIGTAKYVGIREFGGPGDPRFWDSLTNVALVCALFFWAVSIASVLLGAKLRVYRSMRDAGWMLGTAFAATPITFFIIQITNPLTAP